MKLYEVGSAILEQIEPRQSSWAVGEPVEVAAVRPAMFSSNGLQVTLMKSSRNIGMGFVLEVTGSTLSKQDMVRVIAMQAEKAIREMEYQWAVYWSSDLWC